MEHIGAYLAGDEAARSVLVAVVVYLAVAVYKLLRREATDSEAQKFKTMVAAFIASALATLLDVVGANGWTFAGIAFGPVLIRILVSWWASMGAHSSVKKLTAAGAGGAGLLLMSVAVFAIGLCTPVAGAPGDMELRSYSTVIPEPAEDWGAGIAYELATTPTDWWLIGGRKAFLDLIQLESRTILGGSLSTMRAEADDGWRAWGAIWVDGGHGQYAAGLSMLVTSW